MPAAKSQIRPLPDNITLTNSGSYQVRIVRAGNEMSASFSIRRNGGDKAAIAAAVVWRDMMLKQLPMPMSGRGGFRTASQSNKRSYQRVGLSRHLVTDHRRENSPKYLRFGVNWVDEDGSPRVKQFQAGIASEVTWEVELHAALTAEAFRTHWEYARVKGLEFDPTPYAGWKTTELYPFTPDSFYAAESCDTTSALSA